MKDLGDYVRAAGEFTRRTQDRLTDTEIDYGINSQETVRP